MTIGPCTYRFRWAILAAWAGVAIALGAFVGPVAPGSAEQKSFLPETTDYSRATEAQQECFPHSTGLSEAVVVFERADGELTDADADAIEAVANAIVHPRPPEIAAADLAGVTVRSPRTIPLPANPLKSRDARAALIVVNVPANFITIRSARIVDHVRAAAAAAELPPGLAASVTGSSGFGHDYAAAAERSHQTTLYVTLTAVICILLLVYRAPLAAMTPLIAISTAAFVAMKLLAVAQQWGMHVGTGEKVFVVVLIYGAGMDYSMLFISRCREFLQGGDDVGRAVAAAHGATFSAILASAGTDTVGLMMLCFARYGVFRTAGPAIAAALIVALLAAVTLVPALVALLGRAVFWPARSEERSRRPTLWPWIARRVVARPGWVLAVAVLLLVAPAVQGLQLTWVYDALAEVRPARPEGVGNAAVGIAAVRRHWPTGQIAPVTVLVRSDKPVGDGQWEQLAEKLGGALSGVAGVRDVRSLTQPLGREADLLSRLALKAAAEKVRAEHVSADPPAMRLTVVLDRPAYSLESMAAVQHIRRLAEETAGGFSADPAAGPAGRYAVHVAGATAEMIEIRAVTQADFPRIVVLVLGVIFLMVFALLRDAVLSAFMVGGTVLSYFATLGLSHWAFAAVGAAGLDWKVEVFLFVVMVAVGVDYSIFLAARVSQEVRTAGVAEAVRRGIEHTGPVISSCGIIMAATLGSLMAGELKLLVQLGFAMALGMLIDTFIVRPLLLPAFIALTGRTGKAPKALE